MGGMEGMEGGLVYSPLSPAATSPLAEGGALAREGGRHGGRLARRGWDGGGKILGGW
jgi:hypothetical protein